MDQLCSNPKCGRFVPAYRRAAGIDTCSTACAPSQLIAGSGLGLASATVGAIAEMAVAIDLLRRGCPVFRALSPSCPCDLIAIVNGQAVRVEVRSGSRIGDGTKFSYAQKAGDAGKSDMLAIYVHREQCIVYQPNPFEPESSTARN